MSKPSKPANVPAPEFLEADIVAEVEETTPDLAPTPALEVEAAPVADTYTVAEGDTYASIAANHPASGLTNYQRAVQLHELNKGKAINAGTIIKL